MATPAIRAIIVDDEPALLEISKQYLENNAGISADTASSAADALQLIEKNDYEIIVCDYQMPSMDGIELLKRIRSARSDIPFILFTGKGREDVAIEALNAGADFYLQKGGNPQAQFAELKNMIAKSVEKHRIELSLRENERKFENIFNSTNDSIHILDADGRILEMNNVGCTWLGLSRSEMLGMSIKEIDTDEYAAQAQARMNDVMEKGFAVFEAVWKTKDGRTLPVEISARRIEYAGRPSVLSVARDVSERKRSQDALRESEGRYRQLFDASPDGIVVIGVDGRIIAANDAQASMYRFGSPDDLIGIHATSLIAESSRAHSAEIMRRRLQGEEIRAVHYKCVRTDGTTFCGEITASLMRGADGSVSGYICITRDTTDHMKAEEALQKSEEKYRQLVESSSDGIFTIDLRANVNWANRYAIGLLGYGESDLPVPLRKLIPMKYWPAARKLFNEGLKGKIVTEPFELEVVTKDRRRIPVSYKGMLLHDKDGKVIGVHGVIRELRGTHRLKEEPIEGGEEAETAD